MGEPLRTEAYENAFFADAVKQAERRFGLSASGFPIAVKRRLAVGQKLYGVSFMTKPQKQRAGDILEEAWDAAAYAVLDTQVRLADVSDDAEAWRLFEIAVHAAAIDVHARALRSGE